MQCGQALGRAAVLPVDDQRGKARSGVGGVHAHEVSIRITARGVVGRWRGWWLLLGSSLLWLGVGRPPTFRGTGGFLGAPFPQSELRQINLSLTGLQRLDN